MVPLSMMYWICSNIFNLDRTVQGPQPLYRNPSPWLTPRTVANRAVRILLECFLVVNVTYISYITGLYFQVVCLYFRSIFKQLKVFCLQKKPILCFY